MSGRSADTGSASAADAPSRRVAALLLAVLCGALVSALVVVVVGGGRAVAQDGPGPRPPAPLAAGPALPLGTLPLSTTAPPPVSSSPAPPPTAASGGGGRRYVALGDSWAAGSAAPVDPLSGTCRRSADAYPALAGPGLAASAWVSRACASTRTGPNTQFDSLGPDTAVVSVTVGADATGLGDHARSCGSEGDVMRCDVTAVRFDRALVALPAALDASLGELRTRAPAARVVVTGYPLLAEGVACLTGPADTARARRLDEAVARLDAVLADRSRVAGLTFVDVRSAFAGHGVCAAEPWLGSVSVPDPLLAGAATAIGHTAGFLGAVEAALAPPPTTTTPTPTGTTTPTPTDATRRSDPRMPDPAPVAPTFTQLPARSVEGLLQPLFAS